LYQDFTAAVMAGLKPLTFRLSCDDLGQLQIFALVKHCLLLLSNSLTPL